MSAPPVAPSAGIPNFNKPRGRTSFSVIGLVRRNSLARVMRDGTMIHESKVSSLRRFKDDVREVANGLECGVGVEGFDTFEEGDIIEAFHTEQKG